MTDHPDIRLPKFSVEQIFTALSQSDDWGIRQMKIKKLWKDTKGENIKIAVLDTGCPVTKKENRYIVHPDLKNNILVEESKSFCPDEDICDYQGHATAVCGVIAAEDNTIGFVGYAPNAKIVCYKVLNRYGSGSLKWIERALEKCVETKPDIVSMSLGSIYGTPKLHDLVKKLDSLGIPVICAAGNGGKEQGINFPATYNEAFAIGAYDEHLNIADFSAIGPQLDFAFPGVDINTTWLNGGYTKISGTSFACPSCTGLCALILSKKKNTGTMPSAKNTMWLYDELKKLARNPKKIDTQTSDWGWGYVDVQKMIDSDETVKQLTKDNVPIFEQAYKNGLSGSTILDSYPEEELRELYSSFAKGSLSKIKHQREYAPACFVYYARSTIGGSKSDFLAAFHELVLNIKTIIKENYSFINPMRWFRTLDLELSMSTLKELCALLWNFI